MFRDGRGRTTGVRIIRDHACRGPDPWLHTARASLATAAIPLALAAAASACREPDRPLGPEAMGWIAVDSDPRGASIHANGQDTGLRTPDTVRSLPIGEHEISAALTAGGVVYAYTATVRNQPDTVVSLTGPLLARCVSTGCAAYVQPNRLRFALRPIPTLFFVQGQGEGLFWPREAANSYASGAAPVIAGVVAAGPNAGATVALGPYDAEFFAARPAFSSTTDPDAARIAATAWVLPPGQLAVAAVPVPRGLTVRQQLVAPTEAGADDLLFVRITVTNIADSLLYRLMDPAVASGLTLRDVWVGFAFDLDIGESEDDLVTYVPELDLAIGYDSDFRESGFDVAWRNRPAILGLRLIERPAGAQRVILAAWERGAEWSALGPNQAFGWQWLSGTQDPSNLGNHPDPRIGYAPTVPADLRMAVSAGPLMLAPGDTASFTVAVIAASPMPNTFTSGQLLEPGDPLEPNRKILEVAGELMDRARAAPELWERLKRGS